MQDSEASFAARQVNIDENLIPPYAFTEID